LQDHDDTEYHPGDNPRNSTDARKTRKLRDDDQLPHRRYTSMSEVGEG
jgi:hypothetical protein